MLFGSSDTVYPCADEGCASLARGFDPPGFSSEPERFFSWRTTDNGLL
jgi:hypothetical protein